MNWFIFIVNGSSRPCRRGNLESQIDSVLGVSAARHKVIKEAALAWAADKARKPGDVLSVEAVFGDEQEEVNFGIVIGGKEHSLYALKMEEVTSYVAEIVRPGKVGE